MFHIRTYVDKSAIHGIGVFAGEDIPDGTLVWEFHPLIDRLITEAEIHTLPLPVQEMVRKHAEFVESEAAFILSGDNDRFMNHSATPNIRDEGERMFSNTTIPKGTELTCDYRQVRILDFEPE